MFIEKVKDIEEVKSYINNIDVQKIANVPFTDPEKKTQYIREEIERSTMLKSFKDIKRESRDIIEIVQKEIGFDGLFDNNYFKKEMFYKIIMDLQTIIPISEYRGYQHIERLRLRKQRLELTEGMGRPTNRTGSIHNSGIFFTILITTSMLIPPINMCDLCDGMILQSKTNHSSGICVDCGKFTEINRWVKIIEREEEKEVEYAKEFILIKRSLREVKEEIVNLF